MKKCTYCRILQPIINFSKATREKDGVQHRCKICNSKIAAEYRANNIEKERIRHAKYHAKNKENINARISKWQKENPDKIRAKAKRYYFKNLHKNAQRASKRRAVMRNAIASWADKKKIDAIYAECARITKETGIEHHVDHIIPLVSEIVCGLHCEANLQILPGFENQSKHNRLSF